MTTNNLSSLIPSQLPEFIREEYPTFVKFLETYYEYLELEKNPQDILQNLRQYTDIDETLDEFVSVFQKQYLNSLPDNIVADKRLLAKHIQDLYKIKGTEKSYQLLFRVLFNEDVELYYPKINILKTSDGKWVQDRSLQVKPVTGNALGLVGSAITARNDTGTISTLVTDVKAISSGLFEVFISNNYRGTFKVGDKIVSGNFVGTVMPTVTSYSIFRPGSGFKLGQIFPISNGGGKGSYAKVIRISPTGGVTGLSLMTFGTGYVSDFYSSLNNTDTTSTPGTPYDQFTHGFIESGFITKADYFSDDYATPDFAAQVIAQFGGNTFIPDSSTFTDDHSCVIYMRLGAVANYPGFYKTTDGFLSDINAIQDSNYYQDYSYVIKSRRKLNEYKNFVKNILHPAGMKMFGEYQIVNELELGDFLEYDKVVLKLLEMKDYASVNDALAILFGAQYADTANAGDAIAIALAKLATDIATTADAIAVDFTKVPLDDPTYQADSTAIYFGKVVADTVTTGEAVLFGQGTGAVDNVSNIDATTLNIGMTITPDISTVSDSGDVSVADYYVDYAPPDYAATSIRSF